MEHGRRPHYTGRVETYEWHLSEPPETQVERLCRAARRPGFLIVTFSGSPVGPPLPWATVAPWTRSRAVTVADIRAPLGSPALDLALCSDLVYLRPGGTLEPGAGSTPPSEPLVWALARAGTSALRTGLLEPAAIPPAEAVRLGLAHAVVELDRPLPLPDTHSRASLTAARDLLRARGGGRAALQLELATFRLMFATGAPAEGARAFLEGRAPRFAD